MLAPFELTEDGLELLRRSGYVSTTYQPAEGDRSGGVSSVLLFETEAGARDWMALETSDEVIRLVPYAKIRQFAGLRSRGRTPGQPVTMTGHVT
jgi:hypothetical protein